MRVNLAMWITAWSLKTRQAEGTKYPHGAAPLEEPKDCATSTVIECPTCTAEPRGCRNRMRRSWSSLNNAEKQRYINALHTLKWTSTDEGQQLYGKDFVTYDELILRHATAENDPRGDQGHIGEHFAIWHSLFVLKFENALLSVDPKIGGSPYWDLRDGLSSVFGSSSLDFGSSTGTGSLYSVEDGAFSNWTVSEYDTVLQETTAQHGISRLYEGLFSNITGRTLLRQTDVLTEYIVRYPSCTDAVGPTQYKDSDYDTCVNETTLSDFNWCLESGIANGAHEFTHFWIGSADSDIYGFGCPLFFPPNLTLAGVRVGDYIDKSTSVNDPIFFLHHTFVDLMKTDFMRSNPEGASSYWSFHAEKTNEMINPWDGTFLYDEVNSLFPFLGSEFLDSPKAPQGPLKYWEAMCWVGPDTSTYTYDIFDDSLCAAVEEAEPVNEDEAKENDPEKEDETGDKTLEKEDETTEEDNSDKASSSVSTSIQMVSWFLLVCVFVLV